MKIRLAVMSLTIAATAALSACGAGGEAASGNQKNVKNITVGTGTQFPNICFIDDKGKLTGYDVELVKELDRRLPDYRFTFKTMDFSNLLVSLG
ncbi:transporter substrate-binding domain-containing protein, partial [Bacillus tropicus]